MKDDQLIYRYITLGQFIHMVERKRIYLSKVIKWEDPQEGFLISVYINLNIKRANNSSNDAEKKDLKKLRNDFQLYKDLTFGTSWSFLNESDAMWRIYSKQSNGVQIQTTVKKLKNVIANSKVPQGWDGIRYTVGKVDYDGDDPAGLILSKLLHAFLQKDKPFEHEKEVRGLILPFENKNTNIEQPGNDVIYAPIQDDFIEAVKIDPRAENWFVEAVKSYCKKAGIEKCAKSVLYAKLI